MCSSTTSAARHLRRRWHDSPVALASCCAAPFRNTTPPPREAMTGFVIFDYADRYAEGFAQLAKWLHSGELRSREHVVSGDVNDFPETLLELFRGENTGKLVLELST